MTDTPERNDRGIVIGGGPFQPPTKSELELLREERNDLVNEVARLKDRNEQLQSLASRRGLLLDVTTVGGLQTLLQSVLESVAEDVTVEVDGDEHGVTVELTDIIADSDGNLTAPTREFEVTTTISFEHSATIRATDRDTAHDLYADMLRDRLFDIDFEIRGDEVEDQYTGDAQFDFISVAEL